MSCEQPIFQGMRREGAGGHPQVRCAVARVRAKSILKSVRDVRFGRVITILQTFWNKKAREMLLFVLKTILERPFLL